MNVRRLPLLLGCILLPLVARWIERNAVGGLISKVLAALEATTE